MVLEPGGAAVILELAVLDLRPGQEREFESAFAQVEHYQALGDAVPPPGGTALAS